MSMSACPPFCQPDLPFPFVRTEPLSSCPLLSLARSLLVPSGVCAQRQLEPMLFPPLRPLTFSLLTLYQIPLSLKRRPWVQHFLKLFLLHFSTPYGSTLAPRNGPRQGALTRKSSSLRSAMCVPAFLIPTLLRPSALPFSSNVHPWR